MNKFKVFMKQIGNGINQNAPIILAMVGVSTQIGAIVMAVKATPKAKILLEEAEHTVKDENNRMEVVKAKTPAYVKAYWPVIAMEGISISCLVGANYISLKRQAAFATAATVSAEALKEYQAKVIEKIGEKKESQVREEVQKEHLKNDEPKNATIIVTGTGEVMCYDSWSGRYFKCNPDTIKKAVNDLNFRLIDEMYVSINDLYYEIGLPSIVSGDDNGWDVSNGQIDISFSYSGHPDTAEPVLELGYYNNPPRPRFDYLGTN